MKVGIDISSVAYGTGVSNYTLNLVRQLLKLDQKTDYRLVGFSLRRRQMIKDLFPQAKIWPLPLTLMDILWNKLHVFPIEKTIGDVDVFHSSDWTQPPAKAKKVTTIHDLSPFLYPQEVDPQLVAVHTQRMKWVEKECDQVICVSQNTALDVQRLFNIPKSRITVIHEALTSNYLLKPRMTKHKNYLVTIGARQPRKNTARLISSYLKYKDKLNLPPKLVVVGEYTKIYEHPSILYTGYIPDQDMVDLLAGADAFIYPSLYEGFGLPVLGAFHHRVPVVASDTSSLPEICQKAAILVNPLSEESIATGIAQAIEQKDKLIELGQKRVLDFSWEKAALETIAVYKSLC